jgi:hypothetical protein
MKGYWNQLRPLEKRLVVGVGAVVFIVLNAWFVVPHFSDWGKVQRDVLKARHTLEVFNAALARTNQVQLEIKKLEDEGEEVPQEDQATHFASTIQSQAIQSGVGIDMTGKIQATTNQNFYDLVQNNQVRGKEQQLVDFLYNLGAGNSLIRVRDLTLHPDQSRQMLAANIQFVGSYQRKMPVRGAAAPRNQPAKTTPASAPAATPQRKPSAPKTTSSQPKSSAPVTTSSQPNSSALATNNAQRKFGPTGPQAPLPGPRQLPTNFTRPGAMPMRPGMTNKTVNTKQQ